MDWRGGIVAVAYGLSVLATFIVYTVGVWRDPSTHVGAVFAGWVSGLLLFTVIGAAAAIVSLARPERESFDARARILFRRQTGKHIDYIVLAIRDKLEHYSDVTSMHVTIRGHDAAQNKYRVEVDAHTVLRSYLDDIVSTYSSDLEYEEMTLPPPGGERNRLVYVRINHTTEGDGEEFDDFIKRPISAVIEPDGLCEVDYKLAFWVRANDESNTHTPQRYTQLMSLIFENHLPRPVSIRVRYGTGKDETLSLGAGVAKKALELRDLTPNQIVYDYVILSP
jgi:hypothetical protein